MKIVLLLFLLIAFVAFAQGQSPACNATTKEECLDLDRCGFHFCANQQSISQKSWCTIDVVGVSVCVDATKDGRPANFSICSSWISDTKDDEVKVAGGIISALCIIVGIYLIFLGYAYFPISSFAFGVVAAGAPLYLILDHWSNLDLLWLIIIPVAVGFIFGIVLCFAKIASIGAMGAAVGLLLATAVVSSDKGQLLRLDEVRSYVIVSSMVIWGFFVLVFVGFRQTQKGVGIFVTSVVGAFGIGGGIDYFAHAWGGVFALQSIIQQTYFFNLYFNWKTWTLWGGMVALAVLGMVVQWITEKYLPRLPILRRKRQTTLPILDPYTDEETLSLLVNYQ